MLRPSRHDHKISGFDILVFTRDSRFAGSGGEGQGLIDRMHLQTKKDSASQSASQ